MANLPSNIKEQIEKAAESMADVFEDRISKVRIDGHIGTSTVVDAYEEGYIAGATAYALKWQQAEEMIEKMRLALTMTVFALKLSYNVTEHPADGQTEQDSGIRIGEQALAEYNQYKGGEKKALARTVLAIAEDISKDAESAEAYLKSEGVDIVKLNEDARYITWKAELIKLVSEASGESKIKINDKEARKWYEDGATPYQTFRETWNME